MATILVTGGSGYIGSIICAALAEKAEEQFAKTRVATTIVNCDIVAHVGLQLRMLKYAPAVHYTHRYDIDSAVEQYRPDCVVHCAALTNPRATTDTLANYWDTNVRMSLGLLGNLHNLKCCRRFIFLSSCTANQPDSSVYAKTKRTIEEALRAYSVPHTILRLYNVAGAAHGFGEAHDPEWHLIPRILRAAYANEPVTLNVLDPERPDCFSTRLRTWIDVEAVAGVVVSLVEPSPDGICAPWKTHGAVVHMADRQMVRTPLSMVREVETAIAAQIPVLLSYANPNDADGLTVPSISQPHHYVYGEHTPQFSTRILRNIILSQVRYDAEVAQIPGAARFVRDKG